MYTEGILFEWDEAKRLSNIKKHGVDFERAKRIWHGWVVEAPARTYFAERRFIAIGESEGRVITVVFTWRGAIRRIISARIARKSERKDYENEIKRHS